VNKWVSMYLERNQNSQGKCVVRVREATAQDIVYDLIMAKWQAIALIPGTILSGTVPAI